LDIYVIFAVLNIAIKNSQMSITFVKYLIILMLLFPVLQLSSQEVKMNDWANLNRFSFENKELGLPEAGERRVVFMGNSITAAWESVRPEFFNGKNYINRGISGQTTPQMLVRFRADVINLNPSVVVILGGINDIAGNTGPSSLEMIQDNLASMSELAGINGIKVILCSVLPAFDFPWRPGLEPAGQVVRLNEWIKTYAEDNGHFYVDFFSAMVDNRNGMKSDFTYDEVHPTEAGYVVMEQLLEKAINYLLVME
jgi:lysophospholipase L1-like esterase